MRKTTQRRARTTAAIERTAVREVAAVIEGAGDAVAARIASGQAWLPALNFRISLLQAVLTRALTRGAVAGADDVLRDIPRRRVESKARQQTGNASAFVLSWVRRHSVKRVAQITKTTARAVRRQIITGTRLGWSQAKIAESIREATAGEIGRKRAERIARTETHTAFERGSYEQAKELRTLGLDIVSEWAAVEDERTRPDHAEADGQTVGLGKPFTVGNEAMRFPGDPRASARQIVSCRCTALYYVRGTR